jgi:glyoxylase-like metal-dependent hydrolase (beta-lactamase superfamily II)
MSFALPPLARITLGALCFVGAVAGAPQGTAASPSPRRPSVPSFRLERLADGVYAAIRTEGAGHIIDGNSLLIITERDVIVVDANLTPASAQGVIAALRKLTPKPVRYVINTHFVDDHVLGNQAYAEAYPGVEFIAHPLTRDDMLDFATGPRTQFARELPGNVAFARKAMGEGKGFDGQPLTPRKRAILVADTLLANHFVAEFPKIRVTPPTVVVRDRMTIHRPGKTIDITYHGPAETEGDLSVFIREDGILAAGDLVSWPIPYASPLTFVGGWAEALRSMQALGARVIVPGHGEVIRDTVAVSRLIGVLTELERQAGDAAKAGLTLEEFRKRLDLREHRRAFTGDDPALDELWNAYFLFMSASRAFDEATGKVTRRTDPR